MLKIQKVPFDSYENTYFFAKILIFLWKNTEIGKSNLAALLISFFRDLKLNLGFLFFDSDCILQYFRNCAQVCYVQ